MSLRRHIAFVAVLMASAVMLVHAVVPHHGHAATETIACMADDRSIPIVESEACCEGWCEGATECVAQRPYLLRYEDDRSQEKCQGGEVLPTVVCEYCTGYCNTSSAATGPVVAKHNILYGPFDARLLMQWSPDTRAGRAPPVLRFFRAV